MWRMFTEQARKTIFYAEDEAIRFGQNQVSTEHIFLGLIREECTATDVLNRLGIKPAQIKTELESQAVRGIGGMGQDLELGPYAKRVIDLAYEESRNLIDDFIGTEHFLLGLMREEDGLGGRILRNLASDLETARKEVRFVQQGKALVSQLAASSKTENEYALQTVDLALLQPAISKNAIMLKVEPLPEKASVLHLFEDAWQEFYAMPLPAYKGLLDCCKLAARLDILSQEPQQGEITVRYGDKDRTFIVTFEPAEHGEQVTFSAIITMMKTVV